jgi:hypothetical protein
MRFERVEVFQATPSQIRVETDMTLWHGKKVGKVSGGAGVALDVGVYAPEDKICFGPRVATYTSKFRPIEAMDAPVKDNASVVVEVPALPPGAGFYNVVVQMIGGNVMNPTGGIVSKANRKLLPPWRPHVFHAGRHIARPF